MAKTIDSESLIEACEEDRCLWDANSVIYESHYKNVKSRKKLAEQFSITGTVKTVMSS